MSNAIPDWRGLCIYCLKNLIACIFWAWGRNKNNCQRFFLNRTDQHPGVFQLINIQITTFANFGNFATRQQPEIVENIVPSLNICKSSGRASDSVNNAPIKNCHSDKSGRSSNISCFCRAIRQNKRGGKKGAVRQKKINWQIRRKHSLKLLPSSLK